MQLQAAQAVGGPGHNSFSSRGSGSLCGSGTGLATAAALTPTAHGTSSPSSAYYYRLQGPKFSVSFNEDSRVKMISLCCCSELEKKTSSSHHQDHLFFHLFRFHLCVFIVCCILFSLQLISLIFRALDSIFLSSHQHQNIPPPPILSSHKLLCINRKS